MRFKPRFEPVKCNVMQVKSLCWVHFFKMLVKAYQLKIKVAASKERVHIHEIKKTWSKNYRGFEMEYAY